MKNVEARGMSDVVRVSGSTCFHAILKTNKFQMERTIIKSLAKLLPCNCVLIKLCTCSVLSGCSFI